MEALLTDEWLGDLDPVFVIDEASLSLVRERTKQLAGEQGVASELVEASPAAKSTKSWFGRIEKRRMKLSMRMPFEGTVPIAAMPLLRG